MTKINKINLNKKTKSITFVIIIIIFVSMSFFILEHKFFIKDYRNSKDIEEFTLRDSASYAFEWYKLFGGSSDEYFADASSDNSGNIYASGRIGNIGVIAKFNSSGDLQWNTTLSNSVGSIVVASSGDIYCILTKSAGFNITKLNNNGEIEWTRAWGSSSMDVANDIALDSSENIYVTGAAYSPSELATDILVLKYSKNGVKLWERTWAATTMYDQGFAISIDISNYIYIAGYASGTDLRDGCVVKYNSNGDRLGQQILSAGTHHIKGITAGTSGETFILGQNDDFSSFLMKLDSSFTPVWTSSLGGDPFEVIRFSDNLYAVLTDLYSNYFTLYQFDTSGVLVKQRQWDFPFCTYNIRGLGVCVDNNENVYVPGYVEYCSADEDAFLIKFGHDTDEDGLTDYQEQNIYFTDFNNPDSDGDLLQDGHEISGVNNTAFGNEPTDPNLSDSDDDGANDYEEISGNLNVNFGNQPTNPNDNDTDNDGLYDGAEIDGSENINFSYSPTNPNNQDTDSDDLPDLDEILIHSTDPNSDDTDLDFLTDGEEVSGSENIMYNNEPTNPLIYDCDEDGLSDYEEINLLTNPNNNDTDSDGYSDGWEITNGYDPKNPNDPPEDSNGNGNNPSISSYDIALLISFFTIGIVSLMIQITRKQGLFLK